MADTDDDGARKAPDSKEQEDQWKAAMFAVAIIGGGVLAIVLWRYVFQGSTTEEIGRRMTIMVPIGTLYIAAVTFMITYWRGLITTRQADQQRQQIDTISRQVGQQASAQTSARLEQGMTLVQSRDPEEVEVGITILGTVCMADEDHFAIPAMNILANLVEQRYKGLGIDPLLDMAMQAMESSYIQRGRTATRHILALTDENNKYTVIREVVGASNCTYFFGNITRFDEWHRSGQSSFVCTSFTLETVDHSEKHDFTECKFTKCVFRDFYVDSFLECDINESDFSDCKFMYGHKVAVYEDMIAKTLGSSGNYYYEGLAPIIDRSLNATGVAELPKRMLRPLNPFGDFRRAFRSERSTYNAERARRALKARHRG